MQKCSITMIIQNIWIKSAMRKRILGKVDAFIIVYSEIRSEKKRYSFVSVNTPPSFDKILIGINKCIFYKRLELKGMSRVIC